jgi:hypothetical protein
MCRQQAQDASLALPLLQQAVIGEGRFRAVVLLQSAAAVTQGWSMVQATLLQQGQQQQAATVAK